MSSWSGEIVRSEVDRRSVRRATGGVVPCVAVAREGRLIGHAPFDDEALERREPVVVVGLAGVGVAVGSRTFDLGRECGGPLGPGEDAPLVEHQRHRERLGLPWRAEHRALAVAWNSQYGLDHGAGSRYGSTASTETLAAGSPSPPHSSRASKRTVYSHCGSSPPPRAWLSGKTWQP